jgi:protein involved in sex pheromone biosynthesis
MIKKTISMAALAVALFLASCGGKKESAASIAQKWCDLNGKAHKAEGAAKEAAEAALNKYENEMEEKYKDNKAFMKEIENEAEKCEDASEGR